MEPFSNISNEFDKDYVKYFALNLNDFVKTTPTIKKIKEEFNNLNDMHDQLAFLPFYTVGRLIEIDFKDLKASFVEKIVIYSEGIIKWASERMLRNVI